MSLRMPEDTPPPKVDTFDVLFCLYENGSLSVGTLLDILDVSQEDLESAMREVFPKVGEKLLRDRTALVKQLLELSVPTCARCNGTGNIGFISTVRCPDCQR